MMPEESHPAPAQSNGEQPIKRKRARGDGPEAAPPFAGFRRPVANYVRCPNQYLDLCVPHCSIHVARLVGYLIRETIGWTKRNGEPRREKVSVSYNELVTQARVARAKLRGALDEAVALRFIRCVAAPRRQIAGVSAKSGVYALRWDESGELTRSLNNFRGFKFGGDCRTPLPNGFFDDVLRAEKHSVVRVVSAVLRHTVGYTNGITGERVEEAPLSYNRLIAFSPMDRKTLAAALAHAESAGYIRTVSAGRFSPDKRRQKASVYAVRWDDDVDAAGPNGLLIPPERTAATAGKRFMDSPRKGTRNGSPIPPVQRFTDYTSDGSDNPPEKRFTPSTTRKTAPKRQQQSPVTVGAAVAPLEEASEPAARLEAAGFAPAVARRLLCEHGAAEVGRQLDWLPRRSASRNVLGLLRRAIEEAWAEPTAPKRAAAAPPPTDDPAARERAREAHERRRRPAYLQAVAGHEAALQTAQPARHAAFAEERAERRRALERESAAYPPRVRANVLRQFDTDAARLADLADAFADDVPDFWAWDAADHGAGE